MSNFCIEQITSDIIEGLSFILFNSVYQNNDCFPQKISHSRQFVRFGHPYPTSICNSSRPDIGKLMLIGGRCVSIRRLLWISDFCRFNGFLYSVQPPHNSLGMFQFSTRNMSRIPPVFQIETLCHKNGEWDRKRIYSFPKSFQMYETRFYLSFFCLTIILFWFLWQ